MHEAFASTWTIPGLREIFSKKGMLQDKIGKKLDQKKKKKEKTKWRKIIVVKEVKLK